MWIPTESAFHWTLVHRSLSCHVHLEFTWYSCSGNYIVLVPCMTFVPDPTHKSLIQLVPDPSWSLREPLKPNVLSFAAVFQMYTYFFFTSSNLEVHRTCLHHKTHYPWLTEIQGSLQFQCISKPAEAVILTVDVPQAILFMTFWLLWRQNGYAKNNNAASVIALSYIKKALM